ncbi:hypothetical protein KMC50_gp33 [Ralstonia phage Claudette]|nr:hypothetical protein KMC50_gp33 [Ralstonia phage Claudette]QMV32499.1 hypothetical protein 20A_00050 [Ralstonia phage Alix]QMV32740.1 hypothetical protein 20Ca_00033 [Ralstonia phage Claudette]
MKPFDSNQFQAGATALTPSGRKVTFVAFIASVPVMYPIVAHIEGDDWLTSVSIDGVLQNTIQLTMAPVKRTVFVNLYREDDGRIVASHETHSSEDEATYDRLSSDYIGAFPIEIEE